MTDDERDRRAEEALGRFLETQSTRKLPLKRVYPRWLTEIGDLVNLRDCVRKTKAAIDACNMLYDPRLHELLWAAYVYACAEYTKAWNEYAAELSEDERAVLRLQISEVAT